MSPEPFCSQLSRASALPLHGSATQVEVWVLLEHAGSWPAQWLEGNDLPETVQTWTRLQERTVPRSRVAFIKRDHSGPDRSLYIAVTDPATPRLYHLRWRDYSDLLAIDVAAVIAGEAQADLVDEILAAVCTHGRRDRCCAKFGLPVYRGFQSEPGLSTWQCTHLGGHRFAANAIFFPSGICYGYLSPKEVAVVAEAARSDQIHLLNYRGRSSYGGPENAADYFVRHQTEITGAKRLRLEAANDSGTEHRVSFSDGGLVHRVELTATVEPTLASCGKPPKPETHYRLLRYSSQQRPTAGQ